MSSLGDSSGAFIFVKGTIAVPNTAPADAATNNPNKKSNIQKLRSIY